MQATISNHDNHDNISTKHIYSIIINNSKINTISNI